MSGTDVTIDSSAELDWGHTGQRLVTISPTLSYLFYVDGSPSPAPAWRKSTDGGATWGTITGFGTEPEPYTFSVYYARWTSSGAPNSVYLCWDESIAGSRIRFAVFDVATETFTTPETTIHSFTGSSALAYAVGIVYARDGNLVACGTAAGKTAWTGRSTDAGVTWTTITSLPETSGNDEIMLWPDFSSTTDDVLALFWDDSASEISVKQLDVSLNTVTETSIATSMSCYNFGSEPHNWSSTMTTAGLVLLAVINRFTTSPMNLTTYDINGATVTARTDVLTATAWIASPGLSRDSLGNTYCFYARDPEGAANTSVGLYYKKSADNMVTWGSEVQISDGEDYQIVYCVADPKPTGALFPIWYDYLQFDLLTPGVQILTESLTGTLPLVFTLTGTLTGVTSASPPTVIKCKAIGASQVINFEVRARG